MYILMILDTVGTEDALVADRIWWSNMSNWESEVSPTQNEFQFET